MDQKLLNEYTELYNDIVTMESLSQYEKLDSGENNSFDGVGGGSRAKRAPRRSMRRGHSVRLKRQKA